MFALFRKRQIIVQPGSLCMGLFCDFGSGPSRTKSASLLSADEARVFALFPLLGADQ
jgi:hypothetical protein